MFKISYIYDLVDNISPQLKKIQTNLETVRKTANSSMQSVSKSFGTARQNISDFGQSFKNIGSSLAPASIAMGLLGRNAINSASDYSESINKVEVAFGSSAQSVKKFAEIAGKSFGIDRGTALDMAAMFGDMSTSMGLSQEKASQLSTSLVGLAGDLASFKNMRVEEAQTALAGIYTGETESLKRLGVVMTEVNLQQFALASGIRKKISVMSQDEKVMLRYNYIIAMTKNSQGDFLRTQEGFANQQRILASRFKDLSITIGTLLLPYATKIVNVLSSIIDKFQQLSPTTQKFIGYAIVLTAVLAPLFFIIATAIGTVSLLAGGFSVLAGAMGLLFTPIGLYIRLFLGLIYIIYKLKDSFVIVYDFLKDKFIAIFDAIVEKIKMVMNLINDFRNDASIVFNFLGLDNLANMVAPTINNPEQINKPQQFTAGGQLDVNIKGLPKGSNAGFTPRPNNFLPVGVNSVFAGI